MSDEKLNDRNMNLRFSSLLNAFLYFHGVDARVRENPYSFVEVAVMNDYLKLGLSKKGAFRKAAEFHELVAYIADQVHKGNLPSPAEVEARARTGTPSLLLPPDM